MSTDNWGTKHVLPLALPYLAFPCGPGWFLNPGSDRTRPEKVANPTSQRFLSGRCGLGLGYRCLKIAL